jgi:ABC-2 type transport system permease protein
MSRRRVRAVTQKEVREFRRNRFVIGTMAVLPLVFLITPMVTLFRIPASANGAEVRSAVGSLSLLMLIIPLVIPPVIAAYSVVGERSQGTLEPVLGAPVTASELLLGKALAAFVPSVGIAYIVYFIAAISIRIGASHLVSSVVWHAPQLLAQILFTPLLATWSIWVGIGISTRASDVRGCTATSDSRRLAPARLHLPHLVPTDHSVRPARHRARARPPRIRHRRLARRLRPLRPRTPYHGPKPP